ncbi:unnamed protein product [Ectocarpus sp. 12 AP-2014]
MKPDGGLLRAFVVPTTLALAWQAWTTITASNSTLFVSATLEQCHLDCAGNTTAKLVADAALNGGSWSVWDTQRLVGPTEPASEVNATYPYARAPLPLPFHSFCQLGCSYFFTGSPQNTSCSGLCDNFYARNASVGINDYAEKARLECRDGCNIAVLRCQPGYACADGVMSECSPGTYRNTSYDMINTCTQCPKGTYRAKGKGSGVDDCALCPVNTYQNTTGATAETDCIRCPDGFYAEEEGTAECSCVTEDSCLPEWQNFQRDSMPHIGRN